MAQTAVLTVGDDKAANRLYATTVFGVAVTLRNVSVFVVSIGHAPVNVQTRKTLPPTGESAMRP